MQTRIFPIAVLALFACLATPVLNVHAEGIRAALQDTDGLSLTQRIARLQQTLRRSPGDAPTHHALARCYVTQGTSYSRMLAESEIQKALRKEPDNAAYLMTYADLLWRGGMFDSARRKYERVLQLDPRNADAASAIARYYLFDTFRYRNMVGIHQESQLDIRMIPLDIGDEGAVVIRKLTDADRQLGVVSLRTFGDEAQNRAAGYLYRALAANPDHRPSVARLCLLYYESARPDSMLYVAQDFLVRHPDDPEVLLYKGLACQTRRQFEDAARAYKQALSRMSPEDRAVMESVDALADPKAPVDTQTASALDDFWRGRDPLLITPYNERRMEHYGRVAYADLRFGIPEEGIPGWRTDQGRMTIRYGRPLGQIIIRPEVEVPPKRKPHPYRETWAYEGFSITFQNWDGLEHWRFEDYKYPGQPYPVSDKGDLFARFPDRFVDPYKDLRYNLPHQIAAFKGEDGKVRIEASYAVPISAWRYNHEGGGDKFKVDVERGAFLMDSARVEVARRVAEDRAAYPITLDPRGPVLTVHQTQWNVAPGRYTAVVEVEDRRTGRIGQLRREVDARRFSTPGLCLSDLLLTSDAQTDSGAAPNPLRAYGPTEDLGVTFEVYGLTPDAAGRTDYQVSYTLSRPASSELDPGLFPEVPTDSIRAKPPARILVHALDPASLSRSEADFHPPTPDAQVVDYRVEYQDDREAGRLSPALQRQFGMTKKGVSTTVTLRYAGERTDESRTLRIDLRHIPPGIRKLALTVQDLHAETEASVWTLVQVVE